MYSVSKNLGTLTVLFAPVLLLTILLSSFLKRTFFFLYFSIYLILGENLGAILSV